MVTTLLFDFSRVLLFAKDKDYKDDLNPLNKKLLEQDPNYDFLSYFEINQDLLDYLETVKDKYELYMFTSGSIQNNKAVKPALEKIFKSIISAEEIEVSKKDPSGYLEALKVINKQPSEVLFIDDSEVNIKAAKEAGLNVWQYNDYLELKNKISNTLNN